MCRCINPKDPLACNLGNIIFRRTRVCASQRPIGGKTSIGSLLSLGSNKKRIISELDRLGCDFLYSTRYSVKGNLSTVYNMGSTNRFEVLSVFFRSICDDCGETEEFEDLNG